MGLSLPLDHSRVKTVRQVTKRAHAEASLKTRRALTWEMVKELEGCAVDWGGVERVI